MKNDRTKLKAAAGGIMFILAIILIVLTTAFYFSNRASATAQPEDSYLYTVIDYNGKVSVVRRGENTPYEVFDTYTNSLPQADQEELKSGVKIYSNEQLQKAIEDYTS